VLPLFFQSPLESRALEYSRMKLLFSSDRREENPPFSNCLYSTPHSSQSLITSFSFFVVWPFDASFRTFLCFILNPLFVLPTSNDASSFPTFSSFPLPTSISLYVPILKSPMEIKLNVYNLQPKAPFKSQPHAS